MFDVAFLKITFKNVLTGYQFTTKLSYFSSFKFAFMPNKPRSLTSTFSLSENSLFFHQADNLHAIN